MCCECDKATGETNWCGSADYSIGGHGYVSGKQGKDRSPDVNANYGKVQSTQYVAGRVVYSSVDE